MGGPLDTATIVEFSCYLLEIQLHDPTVKVLPAPIINHHKQSIGIALHTITVPLMPVEYICFYLILLMLYPLYLSKGGKLYYYLILPRTLK